MEKCNDPKWASEQLTKEEAIELATSRKWESWTDEQIVRFQLFQKKLCMDFGRFQAAMNAVLKRPVYTHEFADRDALVQEYLGAKPAPTLQEVMNMIPAKSRIIIRISK